MTRSSQLALAGVRVAASSIDSELDLMLALSQHILAELALDELLRRICIFAAELIGADLMIVPILSDSGDSYKYVAATGANADLVLNASFPISVGLCGWVLRNREPVFHGEGHDLPIGERRKWEPGMSSSLLVPLLSRGEIIGGLSGIGKRGGGSFTARDLKLVTLFANHTSVALNNAQAVARERQAREALVAAKRRAEQHAHELSMALTHQKQLEDALLHAQKMESLGRLAGGIAHDFNNILMTVGGSLELAMMELAELELPNTQGLQHLLEDAGQAAARAADLTQQLLAFARRQVVKPAATNLAQSIDEAASMLRRVLPPTIELSCDIAPDLDSVFVDRGQLSQILMNLALNARDALARGGHIRISAYNQSFEAGEASSHDGSLAPGEYVMLVVEDDGVGITPELIPRLFEPFLTTKRAGKGTGLGLATCYGIITQVGGAIWVESTVGVGTRFELAFPRTTTQEQPRVDSAVIERHLPTKIIWVVDDDDAARALICAVLRRLGHTVHASADGAAALAELTATELEVDLLMTDILMPGLDGLELVERLGARHPAMRILFISGYPAEHFQDIVDGEWPFLHKPFLPHQLAEQLLSIFSDIS